MLARGPPAVVAAQRRLGVRWRRVRARSPACATLQHAAARSLLPPAVAALAAPAPASQRDRGAPPASAAGGESEQRGGPLWTLALLFLCYLHASACSFALPALLPDVVAEMSLSDGEAASLTFAFTATYSLLLVPVGAFVDTADRPRLLACGVALWSCGTALAAFAPSYPALLASRCLYAAGYAVQNPVAFGMIAELFPRKRATASASRHKFLSPKRVNHNL